MTQRPPLSGLGRLLPFVTPYRSRVVMAALALLLAAGATLSVPLAFRHLIDAGFGSQQAVEGPFLSLWASVGEDERPGLLHLWAQLLGIRV